ncbi:MAG: hypothetical protein PHD37_00625 [Gallionellaceae bacterium]|nr:hypothetical protein [Gallionellaceae bacterium]
MHEHILNVKVGEGIQSTLDRAARVMEKLERGEEPAPYFAVGFSDMGQMLAVFTPRRWELLAALRAGGPMSIAELARQVGRDYKNVHNDVDKLSAWMAVEKDAQGRVHAPYAEIVLDVHLPERRAA